MNPTVKIGNINYQIETVQHPVCIDNREMQAMISFPDAKIIIRTDGFSTEVQAENWWHEVLHGIIKNRNLNLGDTEEDIVIALSKGLHSLVVDNPYPLPGQDNLFIKEDGT